MAKSIWKFVIGEIDMCKSILAPENAEELSVQWQSDIGIVVWAMCDTEARKEPRVYRVVGTGWEIPSDARRYIGTVQAPGGLVWHVFRETGDASHE